jgi:hypothetical protein
MKLAATLIAIAVLATGGALAARPHYSATLAHPLAAPLEVIVNTTIWECKDSACEMTSAPSDSNSVRACAALKARVGALTAYGADANPFDAARLAQCNSAD